MKIPILSVKQPWAWLICEGHKTCENRSWMMKHRGKIMIHVSRDLRRLFEDVRWVRETYGVQIPLDQMEVGKVIGSVYLKDVVEESDDPWFEGPYGFLLEKPRMLPSTRRFELRGQPGVFYLDTNAMKTKSKRSKPQVQKAKEEPTTNQPENPTFPSEPAPKEKRTALPRTTKETP